MAILNKILSKILPKTAKNSFISGAYLKTSEQTFIKGGILQMFKTFFKMSLKVGTSLNLSHAISSSRIIATRSETYCINNLGKLYCIIETKLTSFTIFKGYNSAL